MIGAALAFFIWNSGGLDDVLARFENQMYSAWFAIRQAVPMLHFH